MSKKTTLLSILAILVIALLAAPVYAAKVRLTFTAGGTGGGWFVMAGHATFLDRPILRERQLDFLVTKKGIDTYPYLLRPHHNLP